VICPDCRESDENGQQRCHRCKAEDDELNYAIAVEAEMPEEDGGRFEQV
jgi:hypothetical protein